MTRRKKFTEWLTRLPAWGYRLAASFFPRPRQPVSWRDAWPVVGFLAAYAGLCLWLVFSKRVMFARPQMFALMAVSPWVWWMAVAGYAGLSKSRAAVATLVRLSLAGLFAMVLAEPRSVRTQDVQSIVFCVDVSASVSEDSEDQNETSSNKAFEFVAKTISEKPEKDQAGLVIFARNAAVEQPPRQSFWLDQNEIVPTSQMDRDATNLEQALSLSAAMIPEDTTGRVVLISDATQTEGNLQQVLGELKSRGIAVDVLPISYAYDREVWLERLDLPRIVKLGEPYKATMVISALGAGKGELTLKENGKELKKIPVTFPAGKSRQDIEISLRQPGYYEYTATIDVPKGEDHVPQNNTVTNYIMVAGEGKVMVVVDSQGDVRDWQSMVQAMKEGDRLVDVVSATDLPRDPLSLMPYDAVVFVNVGVEMFDAVQLQAVHDAVHDLGIGFMMVGGQNSFGPGGYQRTVIEDALPVSMDVTQKKVLPKGALAIILHTCEFADGNTWAKRITKQAIKVLSAQDEVGVLALTQNGEEWIFELTPAGDYDKLVPKINGAEIGDMLGFQNAMTMGLAGLKKSDASTRHMIVISDGDPSPPPPALLKAFVDAKVSISTVAVFPHGGNDISLLRAIAEQTGGRYYFPSDPAQLPQIFIKESKTLKRGMINNKTVQPEAGQTSRILEGIDAVPKLHGYVLTTLKERLTENALRVTEEDQIDPILATWSYGLGKTAAFTSDLSPNWGKDWVSWQQYRAFVKQLLIDISRIRRDGQLRLWTQTIGTQAEIFVEDFAPGDDTLEIKARVSGPREKSETVTLKQVGPRRYQASVPLWGRGRYQVLAAGVGGDRKENAQDGFIVSYSPEYLRFRSNPQVFRDITTKTGGSVLTAQSTADEIYNSHRQPKTSSKPIFDWFLIALACLVPLDVAVRRVQIDFSLLLNALGYGRKPVSVPSTASMGTLLDRKKQVGAALGTRREDPPPLPPLSPPTGPTRPPSTGGPPVKPAAPAKPPEPDTTTSRLLASKRKRKSE